MSIKTLDYRAVDWSSLTPPESLCSSCSTITLEALYDGLNVKVSDQTCGLCEAIKALCLTRGENVTRARLEVSETISNRKIIHVGVWSIVVVALGLGDLLDLHELRQSFREKHPRLRNVIKLKPWPFALVTVGTPGHKVLVAKFKALPDVPSFASRGYSVGRDVGQSYSSSTVEMIKSWILDCVAHHPTCRRQIAGTNLNDGRRDLPLPNRLIDVWSKPPKLSITKGHSGRYAALSYCWGGTARPDAMLKKANMEEFQRQLPISVLSRTIMHALRVTRDLGIRYLWVDSLCIIQDDSEDWNKEAPQMGNYYEMAFLTIAALGANTSDDGLFCTRYKSPEETGNGSPTHVGNWAMRIPLNKNKDPSEFSRLALFPQSEHDPDPYATELVASRWRLRGWVVQERLLSRRIVYFGRFQAYWSCKTDKAREDGIAVFPWSQHEHKVFVDNYSVEQQHLMYLHFWLPKLLGKTLGFKSIVKSWKQFEFNQVWNEVVCDYSRCNLTYSTDKDKAIEGLANVIGNAANMTYWVGLWKETIGLCLSWRGVQSFSGPINLQFPSWSWMSRDGAVNFWSRHFSDSGKTPVSEVSFDQNSAPAVLLMRTDLFRAKKVEALVFECHLAKTAFRWGGSDAWPYDEETRQCGQCPEGQCRHGLLVNGAGHVYGLVEFDDPVLSRTEFDCIVLFENAINNIECDEYPALKQFKTSQGRRLGFLAVEHILDRPGISRRIGSGIACYLKGTDVKPDGHLLSQSIRLV